MASLNAIYNGIFLVVILIICLIILGPATEKLPIFLGGFLIIGIYVGYVSYDGVIQGSINGAVVCVSGSLILWILGSTLPTLFPLTSNLELFITIIMGTIGSALGSLIHKLKQKNQKNSRKIREYRDRRDDRYWRD